MQKELDIIMDLMKDLQDKMQYGKDDFEDRLGRKKPDLEIAKVSVDPAAMMGKDPDGDGDDDSMEDMHGGGSDEGSYDDEENDPEEEFKNRLMRMRG